METVRTKMDAVLMVIVNFLNGKFGRWMLIPKIRGYWQVATWGTVLVLFFVYVFLPLMRVWEMVVAYLNYVRWGIE